MATLLAVACFLIPLLILPGHSFYYDVTPKIVVLGLAAAGVLLWRGVWRVPRALLILLGAQAASLAVSTLFSADPMLSIGGSTWRRFGAVEQLAVLVLCAAIAAVPDARTGVLRAISLAGALAGLYGIAQYFGIDPWIDPAGYHAGEGAYRIVRPPATLGHAGYAATFFAHATFVAIALLRSDTERVWRAVGWAAAVICPSAIVLSGTRAALLGVAAGVACFLVRRPKIERRHVMMAAAAVGMFALFFVTPPGEGLRRRLFWIFDEPRGGSRPQIWRDSLAMGMDRWAVGWGPETFLTVFPRYQSEALARTFPDFHHESAHNIFLSAFTEQGVPGLVILIALCAAAWAGRRDVPLFASFVAIVVSQQFTSFTMPTALAFYLMAGLLASRERLLEGKLPWPAALVGLPLAIFVIQLAGWDQLLLRTQRALASGTGVAEYEAARRWMPPGATADLWYSRRALERASASRLILERTEALHAALTAAGRPAEDRSAGYYNVAMIQAIFNDANGTEQSLRKAVEAAPNWYKPRWTLAELLARRGRPAEAQEQARRAAELSGGKHPEVIATRDRLLLVK